jgi:drug/metabolite transporter (DMT)-like permease
MDLDRGKGISALSLAMLLWGFNFVSTKFAVQEVDPFAVTALRSILSALIFGLVMTMRGANPFSFIRENWRKIWPLAFTGIFMNQLFFMWGLKNTTPSHSALVVTLLPIITALFARIILKEKVPLLRWLGISVAFFGAIILVFEGGFSLDSGYLLGDMMTLVSVTCFSLFIVLAKPVLQELGVIRTISAAYILSLPFTLLICTRPALAQDWSSISTLAWGSIWYLIIGATVVAYLSHQYALKRLPATLVAITAYSQPLIAVLFSVWLWGEQPSAIFYFASGLILTGLLIAQKRRRQGKAA